MTGWWEVFTATLGAMAPLLAVFIAFHVQNRSDRKKLEARLSYLLSEYGFHDHTEAVEGCDPNTVLRALGIRRPKNGR